MAQYYFVQKVGNSTYSHLYLHVNRFKVKINYPEHKKPLHEKTSQCVISARSYYFFNYCKRDSISSINMCDREVYHADVNAKIELYFLHSFLTKT